LLYLSLTYQHYSSVPAVLTQVERLNHRGNDLATYTQFTVDSISKIRSV